MKRIISLLAALIMMLTPIFAFADYSSMSDDDLYKELNLIRAELVKREETKEGKIILAEADGITVTLKGEPEWKENSKGVCSIILNVTVVNTADESRGIREDDCYLNGWKISCGFQTTLDAGMKTKETITLYKVNEDADLEALEDLEDIKIVFLTYKGEGFKTLTKDITATLTY